ncbi:hypothetical protein SAMN05216354_0524 [Xylanibacter ruminicola]|uniref:Uncharacterized protein n=1 Tax=Xylanibacter ruminicola TaxID=839 RepID=A0A1H5S5C4_XYLRU|nr:hypothetical protein SAMN05216354_0524 [Xylanibacter ruminicola]
MIHYRKNNIFMTENVWQFQWKAVTLQRFSKNLRV